MKKLWIVLFLSALFISGKAQDKEIAIIQIVEEHSFGGGGSSLSITYPDNQQKFIKWEDWESPKERQQHTKILHLEISKLVNEGYELINTLSNSSKDTTVFQYIFQRTKSK